MTEVLYLFISITLILLSLYILRRLYLTKLKPPLVPIEESQFLEIENFKIRYQISGQGQSRLLLLHGIGANLNTWDTLIPYLQTQFQVLCIDLPGFGESSKPIDQSYNLDNQCDRIKKIVDHLNFTPCIVCGSSMGGAIALWLAHSYPDRFKKVVALAPATSKKLLPLNPKKLLISSRLTSLALNEQTMRLILYRVVHNHDLINPEFIEKYLRHFKGQPHSIKTFIGATDVISDSRIPKDLKDLKTPVLIYWGQHDKMVPYKYMKELSEILPNNKLITDPLSGHHSMEDNPKGLSEAIKQFLFS